MTSLRRSWIVPALFGGIGFCILIALGTWQWQRLAWKEAIIAEAAEKMKAAPVALPAVIDPKRDSLLRVSVTGYLERREIHILTSTKAAGPGFRVITTMALAEDDTRTGRRIMVDLGFVPEHLKSLMDRDPPSRRLQKRHPRDKVTGLLYWPDERDGWTPDPNREKNIWFARDVAQLAEEFGVEPVLLIAESHPDGKVPQPRPPGHNIPNRHLQYVFTWYGMALIWAVMSIIWMRATLRERPADR